MTIGVVSCCWLADNWDGTNGQSLDSHFSDSRLSCRKSAAILKSKVSVGSLMIPSFDPIDPISPFFSNEQ